MGGSSGSARRLAEVIVVANRYRDQYSIRRNSTVAMPSERSGVS